MATSNDFDDALKHPVRPGRSVSLWGVGVEGQGFGFILTISILRCYILSGEGWREMGMGKEIAITCGKQLRP
jgi:hypothetical protein